MPLEQTLQYTKIEPDCQMVQPQNRVTGIPALCSSCSPCLGSQSHLIVGLRLCSTPYPFWVVAVPHAHGRNSWHSQANSSMWVALQILKCTDTYVSISMCACVCISKTPLKSQSQLEQLPKVGCPGPMCISITIFFSISFWHCFCL